MQALSALSMGIGVVGAAVSVVFLPLLALLSYDPVLLRSWYGIVGPLCIFTGALAYQGGVIVPHYRLLSLLYLMLGILLWLWIVNVFASSFLTVVCIYIVALLSSGLSSRIAILHTEP